MGMPASVPRAAYLAARSTSRQMDRKAPPYLLGQGPDPAVGNARTARPSASVSRCRLVLSPPRLRPRAGSAPFLFVPRPRADGLGRRSGPTRGCPIPRYGPARRPVTTPRPCFWSTAQSACAWCANCSWSAARPASGLRCAPATAQLRQSAATVPSPRPVRLGIVLEQCTSLMRTYSTSFSNSPRHGLTAQPHGMRRSKCPATLLGGVTLFPTFN